jgi:glycosyltransferase involved in cell wall biosynthesis
MRHGDKLASYRILAAALAGLQHVPWTLDIAGDGEARGETERLFEPFAGRVRFHGQVENRAKLGALYEGADLFVWPAVNEAYGMVLLEAQMFGCPVVAGAYGGVPSVVKDAETGLLASPGDVTAFAQAILALLEDRERRRRLGAAARRFVAEERGLEGAALRLRNALAPLMLNLGA